MQHIRVQLSHLTNKLIHIAHPATQGKDHHHIVGVYAGQMLSHGFTRTGNQLSFWDDLQQLPAKVVGQGVAGAKPQHPHFPCSQNGLGDLLQQRVGNASVGRGQIVLALLQLRGQ